MTTKQGKGLWGAAVLREFSVHDCSSTQLVCCVGIVPECISSLDRGYGSAERLGDEVEYNTARHPSTVPHQTPCFSSVSLSSTSTSSFPAGPITHHSSLPERGLRADVFMHYFRYVFHAPPLKSRSYTRSWRIPVLVFFREENLKLGALQTLRLEASHPIDLDHQEPPLTTPCK